jgi:hypothetical protein
MHESDFSTLMDAIHEVAEHHADRRRDLRTTVIAVPASPIAPRKVRRLREKP